MKRDMVLMLIAIRNVKQRTSLLYIYYIVQTCLTTICKTDEKILHTCISIINRNSVKLLWLVHQQ